MVERESGRCVDERVRGEKEGYYYYIQRVHVTGGLRRTGRFLLFNMHKLGAKINSDDSRNGIGEQQCQG